VIHSAGSSVEFGRLSFGSPIPAGTVKVVCGSTVPAGPSHAIQHNQLCRHGATAATPASQRPSASSSCSIPTALPGHDRPEYRRATALAVEPSGHVGASDINQCPLTIASIVPILFESLAVVIGSLFDIVNMIQPSGAPAGRRRDCADAGTGIRVTGFAGPSARRLPLGMGSIVLFCGHGRPGPALQSSRRAMRKVVFRVARWHGQELPAEGRSRFRTAARSQSPLGMGSFAQTCPLQRAPSRQGTGPPPRLRGELPSQSGTRPRLAWSPSSFPEPDPLRHGGAAAST